MLIETQIDLKAFADFALDTLDCDERYEDDAFVVDHEGVRWYVERRARWFIVHAGEETVRLPRS